jgi:hypothetical protein
MISLVISLLDSFFFLLLFNFLIQEIFPYHVYAYCLVSFVFPIPHVLLETVWEAFNF